MKAITIHQPYAELIARGEKRVENRSWHTNHRGPLAIHAGLSQTRRAEAEQLGLDFDGLKTGAIIAVAELMQCVRIGELTDRDPYTEGPWCWMLSNVRRLTTPILCSGRQRLWELPEEIAGQIKATLAF